MKYKGGIKYMNFNRKYFNWAIIISLLTAYFLPSRSSDGFAFNYGYPFAFYTRYNSPIQANYSIFNSTLTNILTLALNVLVIYVGIYFINKVIHKIITKNNA
jgi:hypothetical protein